MTTLSLEASKKVFDLIGEYGTENYWGKWCLHSRFCDREPIELHKEGEMKLDSVGDADSFSHGKDDIPAPTFAELIRVLPRISDTKKWTSHNGKIQGINRIKVKGGVSEMIAHMTMIYMYAPSEPQGMKEVEKYLMELL